MPAKSPPRLTPLEAVVMDVLWQISPATVRQVQAHLQAVRPMAYNTVLTVMRILRDKGYLQSARQGRLDVYRPRVSRQQVATSSLGEVLRRFFAGSAAALVSQLLSSEKVSRQEIEAIQKQLDVALSLPSRKEGGRR